MKYAIFAWLLMVVLAAATPLYTTQGLEASGFSDDDDSCSVSVYRRDTGNLVETHTISNDCVRADIAYYDQDCYIYPVDGTVTYTVLLGERYHPGNYNYTIRCGTDVNSTGVFSATAPVLTVIDFNQNPQILTTLKLTARTETEKDIHCTACSLVEKENNCVARVYKTGDNATTALITDIPCNERGVFTFHYFIALENAYTNYTLNLTCDDYSTFQSTFKPVFLEFTDIGVLGFSLGIQAIIVFISLLIGLVMVWILYMFIKVVTRGEYDVV
jgi:hypothetical protein